MSTNLKDIQGLPAAFRKIKALLTSMENRIAASPSLDVVAGVAEASKAVVLSAGKAIATITAATITTITNTTFNGKDIDAGASGTAGTIDIFPATGAKGKTTLTAENNTGNTTTTVKTAAQGGARTYTVPDAGVAAAAFALFTKAIEAANALVVAPGSNVLSTVGTTVLDVTNISADGGEFNLVSSAAQVIVIDFGAGNSVFGAGIANSGSRYLKFTAAVGTSAQIVRLSATSFYVLGTVGTVTIEVAP